MQNHILTNHCQYYIINDAYLVNFMQELPHYITFSLISITIREYVNAYMLTRALLRNDKCDIK